MNVDLIARAETVLGSAKRAYDHGFGSAFPYQLFEALLTEAKRQGAAVQRVREVADKHIGAPCDCNAIAYQIIRALDGEES